MREEEKEEKMKVEVADLAYKKIVYHLIRYPTSKVTGTCEYIQGCWSARMSKKLKMPFLCFTHL